MELELTKGSKLFTKYLKYDNKNSSLWLTRVNPVIIVSWLLSEVFLSVLTSSQIMANPLLIGVLVNHVSLDDCEKNINIISKNIFFLYSLKISIGLKYIPRRQNVQCICFSIETASDVTLFLNHPAYFCPMKLYELSS